MLAHATKLKRERSEIFNFVTEDDVIYLLTGFEKLTLGRAFAKYERYPPFQTDTPIPTDLENLINDLEELKALAKTDNN